MNKSELIDAIAADSGLTKTDVAKAVNAFIGTVEKTLKEGDDVVLTGFGSFVVQDRAARKGRNPSTGEEIEIKAKKVPSFRAGKGLKDAVA